MFTEKDFSMLVAFLKKNDFLMATEYNNGAFVAHGNNGDVLVRFACCEYPGQDWYTQTTYNRIAAHTVKGFDKWRFPDMVIALPADKDYILLQLRNLALGKIEDLPFEEYEGE